MNNNHTPKMQVTNVPHPFWDNVKSPLSAWWRGVSNQHRLKKLKKQQAEGRIASNHELRAGRR